MPLRSHEMIYIFNNGNIDDVNIELNLELTEYAKKVLKFIGKTSKQIERELGHRKAEHFLKRVSTSQFSLPTNKTYDELIDKYNINEMEGFIKYEDLRSEKISSIYNPQKVAGKPYKVNVGGKIIDGVYGKNMLRSKRDDTNTSERFPKSVLKYHQDKEKLHPTQKPLELCEWLIKTYSHEGDLVLDLCMGSGTTPLACKNANRRYIGVEIKSQTVIFCKSLKLFVVVSIVILFPAVNLFCFKSKSDWVKPLPLALSTKVCIVDPPTVKSLHVIWPDALNVAKLKLDVVFISSCFSSTVVTLCNIN